MALDFPNTPTVNQVFDNIWEWDGQKWISAPASIGTVTSITAGVGLTGGVITGAGTIGLQIPVTVSNGGTSQVTFPTIPINNLGLSNLMLTSPGGTNALQAFSSAQGYIATSPTVALYPPELGLLGVGNPELILGSMGGSPTSPTSILSGQSLGRLSWQGYDTSIGGFGIGAAIFAVSTQNFVGGVRGTQLNFQTSPNGGIPAFAMQLLNNASLNLFGNTLYFDGTYNSSSPAPGSSANGPWIYADGTNTILRLGTNANPSYIFEDSFGNALTTLNALGVRSSGNYYTFSNASPSGINGSGGPLLYGDNNAIVAKLGSGTSPGAFIVQDNSGPNLFEFHRADPGSSLAATMMSPTVWRFKQTSGDEPNSGVLNYRGFDASALSIVGAGTNGTNRLVRIYDNLVVNGSWVQLANSNAGFMIGPPGGANTVGISYVGGPDLMLGNGQGGAINTVVVNSSYLLAAGPTFLLGGGVGSGAEWDFDRSSQTLNCYCFAVNNFNNWNLWAANAHFINTYMTVDGNINVNGWGGVAYGGAAYSDHFHYAFGWQTFVGGLATISVENGGAVYALANGSDARMKYDVGPARFEYLQAILALQLRTFRWKEIASPLEMGAENREDGKPTVKVGLIAQEVKEIFPDGVHEGDTSLDKLGRVWSLNQNSLIALLAGGIQELNEEIGKLKNGLAAQASAIRSINNGNQNGRQSGS